MRKFLAICSGLRSTGRLNCKTVNGYLSYMRFESNPDKYYPIELVKFPEQLIPAVLIQF